MVLSTSIRSDLFQHVVVSRDVGGAAPVRLSNLVWWSLKNACWNGRSVAIIFARLLSVCVLAHRDECYDHRFVSLMSHRQAIEKVLASLAIVFHSQPQLTTMCSFGKKATFSSTSCGLAKRFRNAQRVRDPADIAYSITDYCLDLLKSFLLLYSTILSAPHLTSLHSLDLHQHDGFNSLQNSTTAQKWRTQGKNQHRVCNVRARQR